MTPMEARFRRAWLWSQDGAPDWFCAWIGDFMWRPWCWARGYHRPHHCDVHFEICVWCRAVIWSRRRDGGQNMTYRDGKPLERTPATWRRWLKAGA